ncbi:SCO family protein [Aliiroseovarius subalbicans]|uniref:SCO family protein n=1 Tax=Aliiroseovarius subalbicans TaxID=2925840 RepID=UPI001F55DC72|nr:SCO family protein [Aliiroseovarius subalbicans]MCI2400027.1 SCO family protein [Aliiroseovarius subalbicans]
MVRAYVVAALAAIAALLGVTWYITSGPDDQFAQCRGSAIGTGVSSIGGPFEGVDETGKPVTDADIITKPTLLYFGYTFCPDVCPLDNARNAEALDLLQASGYDAQLAFYSIDPQRDTPEQLADFTSYLHDDMIGITGTPEQLKAASRAYKTYYKVEEDGDPEYYLVDHSTFTYLVLPEYGFLEFFKRDETPQSMADRVSCFLDAAK